MKDPADNLTGELPLSTPKNEPAAAAVDVQLWRSVVALTLVCLAASEVLDRKGYDMDSQEFLDLLADKFKANESVHEEARLAMGGVVATLEHYGAQSVLASLGFLHKRSMNA